MTSVAGTVPADPPLNCNLCPRLVSLRNDLNTAYPDWFNAPVPSFASADPPELLIVGLAPGLKGANRTGRPFTGDYAGDLLYETMLEFGFASGQYNADPGDGLTLHGAMITNAVRCLPPENKPTGPEIRTCRPFLLSTLEQNASVRTVLALGRIAHDTFLSTLSLRRASYPFAHGASFDLGVRNLQLFDSYHCSRYNTNTGRLTPEMFKSVFADIRRYLDSQKL
ncbi:uracil-DNA glycosylase family 4 [Roseibium hamelinense]|uniref:Type-5 uracil-DNA glycosylase n=1 Tax=Roseibium hamelinense TaxID=150831 RepID=A0A562TGY1_9HYPH|nr:uracil-DNA glycosylase [Roseibium hamelinense]MTI42388.1 uracil-DNA glycosylase [Roseibium hamelinense]TWI92593.1 uracil-DNA glycosylase family 4 [Roseibium hamelinense]